MIDDYSFGFTLLPHGREEGVARYLIAAKDPDQRAVQDGSTPLGMMPASAMVPLFIFRAQQLGNRAAGFNTFPGPP